MKKLCNSPIEALQKYWGYPDFRHQQQAAIDALMSGRDGLLIMQTSGGKSLCFQVPALCTDGTVIVVSPLISLMKDQVDALERRGIPATFINSSLPPDEAMRREHGASEGKYKLVYLSPERLGNIEFVQRLAQSEIAFAAIDEAHCISTWGHDFRLAYQRLDRAFTEIQRIQGRRLQRFGYTATATPEIRQEIVQRLGLEDPVCLVGTFDRDNITFDVRASREKTRDLFALLDRHRGEPTLVYTATVKAAEMLARELKAKGILAAAYHGRLPTEQKNDIQNAFLNNDIEVVIATNAFGMGVDKPDVRVVVHYHMPGNLENYYQEAGRGGRDGEPCLAYMFYSEQDRNLHEFLIDLNYPPEDHVRDVLEIVRQIGSSDACYMTAMQIAQVSRESVEVRHVPGILRQLEHQGFIKLADEDTENNHFCIEVLDKPIDDLDLSHHRQRREVVSRKLTQIEGFARTSSCRRQYLLRYFGEHSSSVDCGACDICHAKAINRDGGGRIPPEVVNHALGSVKDTGGRFNAHWIRDILLGTQSHRLLRRGHNELAGFGALSHWTREDVDKLISHLEKENLIYTPPQSRQPALVISKKGLEVYANPSKHVIVAPPSLRRISVHEVSGYQTPKRSETTSDVVDAGLVSALEAWLDKASEKHGQPSYMLVSKPTLMKLAKVKPSTDSDLAEIGLTEGRINLFGESLLKAIHDYRTQDKSAPSVEKSSDFELPY